MIILKNSGQLAIMRKAGRITGDALRLAQERIKPGMTTKELDTIIEKYIRSKGAKPSFLGYGGFKGSACISINEQVIHGIPSAKTVIREGDLVKVDVGAFLDGYHSDAARTFAVGKVDELSERLMKTAERAFYEGMKAAVVGNRIGDVANAVQRTVEAEGFSVVTEYIGHGVGQELHEQPSVPNYGEPGHGCRLCEGMTIAIEPMINAGTSHVMRLSDGWTVLTRDMKRSAHYENTIAITKNGPVILTAPTAED